MRHQPAAALLIASLHGLSAAAQEGRCEPGAELSRLTGESRRTDAFLYHDGYLLQKLHGDASMIVWDLHDPRAPEQVAAYDRGWSSHHVHTYIGETALLNWAGHYQIDLSALPELTDRDLALFDPRDAALTALGDNPDGVSQVYYPLGFGNTPSAYEYTRKGYLNIYDMRQPPTPGPEGLSRVPLSRIDILAETGMEGRPNLIGNLLLVTGDNEMPGGLSLYDLSDPSHPVLLDSMRTTPDGRPLIKAYDSVPVWGSYALLINNGDTTLDRGVDVIDFSDPENLRYVGRFDFPGRTRYAQFQDEHMFVGDAKVDMRTFAVEQTFPDGGGEYNLPVGNLLITAGMERPDSGRVWCHQAEPDTRPPQVTFHSPAAGETGVAVTGRVGLVIPETLDLSTITTDNILLRPVGGSPAEVDIVWTDHDVLNVTPRQPLRPYTTYEFVMVTGGLSDVSGNALSEDFRFVFSTGDRLATGGIPRLLGSIRRAASSLRTSDRADPHAPPLLTGVSLDRTAAAVGQPVTYTAEASTAGGAPLSYRFIWGDGSESGYQPSPSASHTYERPGIFSAQVRVRAGDSRFAARAVNINAYRDDLSPGVSSSSIVSDAARGRVWNVNPDNDTVSAIDAASGALLLEVRVPADPRSLALDPSGRVWVVSHDDAQVRVLSGDDGRTLSSIPLPSGSRPFGIVLSPGGETAYVSAMGSGHIYRLDTHTAAITGSLPVGPWPRALALSRDGATLLAARFISPQDHGEVYRVDTSRFDDHEVLTLAMDETSIDADRSARGVPNYLTSIAIAPDGRTVWVGSKEDNVLRGVARDGSALTFETTVRSILSFIDLERGEELAGSRRDVDNQELPTAIAFSSDGLLAYISYQGNNNVIAMAAEDRQVIDRIDVARAPVGLAIDERTGGLYVHNFLSRSVSHLSIYTGIAGNMWGDRAPSIDGLDLIYEAQVVGEEQLGHRVLTGKRLFYDASDERISRDGYLSCAVCHLDGEQDGRVWDFTDRGEGLRNTISLSGRRGTGHGPLHWSANFDEVQDFEHDIRGPFRGTGLMADSELALAATPLGAPKSGRSPDLDALAAYLSSLDTVGTSPHRIPSAAAGRAVFTAQGCASCHGGPDFTDSASGLRHDVGTLQASSGGRLGGALLGIDTPTLRGLWSTAPYLHDGSAQSLSDVLRSDAHGGSAALTAQQRADLVDYLLQIDDQEPAAPPPTAPPALSCTVDPLGRGMNLEVTNADSGVEAIEIYTDSGVLGRLERGQRTLDGVQLEAPVGAVLIRAGGRGTTLTPEVAVEECAWTAIADGFEDDSAGEPPGAPWRVSGALEVTTEQAHSGSHSVKVTAAGGGYSRSFMTLDLSDFVEVQQQQHGRLMIRVEDAVGDFTMVQAEGAGKRSSGAPAGTSTMYRYRYQDSGALMANYDTWVDADRDGQTDWQTDCWRESEVKLPTGQWACLEWAFDAEADQLRYRINGEEIGDLSIDGAHDNCASTETQQGRWIGPERLMRLHIGVEQYHATATPRTVYIDDVQIGVEQVGCP